MPVTLIALLLLTAAIWAGALIVYTAWKAVRPPRMSDGKALYLLKRLSPEDLGLAYTPMRFEVEDAVSGGRLPVAAWWIPAEAPSGRAVIFLHGYGDAKVGAIAWAPTWHALGWNVLAIDQRAHGESGGRFCTGGYYERDDLAQVIDQLRLREPSATARLALFGVSLGTGAAACVAAQRNDLLAVVLDSPFADYRHAILSHLRRLKAPLAVAHPLIVWLAERIARARWSDSRPVECIAAGHAPVLILRGSDDDFVTPADLAALDAAVAARADKDGSEVVVVQGAHHTLALARDPLAYRAAIHQFFARIPRLSDGNTD